MFGCYLYGDVVECNQNHWKVHIKLGRFGKSVDAKKVNASREQHRNHQIDQIRSYILTQAKPNSFKMPFFYRKENFTIAPVSIEFQLHNEIVERRACEKSIRDEIERVEKDCRVFKWEKKQSLQFKTQHKSHWTFYSVDIESYAIRYIDHNTKFIRLFVWILKYLWPERVNKRQEFGWSCCVMFLPHRNVHALKLVKCILITSLTTYLCIEPQFCEKKKKLNVLITTLYTKTTTFPRKVFNCDETKNEYFQLGEGVFEEWEKQLNPKTKLNMKQHHDEWTLGKWRNFT